ncbi:hypothetical protein MKX03_007813 [Papaver bracteatum]|nr:hypothetical protein MKX03_007813 [Papaver bracteatum]
MFDEQWNLQPGEIKEEHFIDRDPECFSVLLNLLRTGELHLPPNVAEKLLYKEALFYGLLGNVKTAKWGRFDGNHLELTSSVRCRAPQDRTAIRASQDGGCAVAHGSMVHVYNWMLEKRTSLNLDYQIVHDMGWIDSENIVVSADGRMGLFSSSTSDLKNIFQLNHENQVKSFNAA